MGQHLRAALGPAGRVELARLQLEAGLTERAAAAALSVAGHRAAVEARIWRYREFAKLVDLIDRDALFFSRADRMVDPWEGEVSAFIEDANTADLSPPTRRLDRQWLPR